jgi:Xaa-Pro aminopeptidase
VSLSLPPLDLAGRADDLRAQLSGAGCDALVLTHLVSIRWLTGFTGSNAMVLVGDELLFVTDGRYGEAAEAQLRAAGVDARIEVALRRADQRDILNDATRGIGRLGLEADAVTWADQRTYDAEWFPTAELVPTTGLVADRRRVKSAAEVARIEAAATIADEALDQLRPQLLDGPSEHEFATALERTMIDLGADERSFPTICAAGPNSARPHAEPGDRRIAEGDLVVIDFGALVDGYHSDMTRTIPVGEVAPEVRELLAVATESQAAGATAVRPGVTAHAIDRACRDVLADHGLEDRLLHGTGHGLGLEIHETPILRPDGAEELREGEVVTVEPGVYLPGTGGARVEDTVVVTATGSRPLTRFPKDADGHLDR